MSDKPKYKVGDEVEFCGNPAKIVAIHEHHYFYGGDSAYYMYDLEYSRGGSIAQVSEAAVHLVRSGPELYNDDKTERLCQCGAWSVPWASEHHARWCPEYEPFKSKE